jgi:hypothetical protein
MDKGLRKSDFSVMTYRWSVFGISVSESYEEDPV